MAGLVVFSHPPCGRLRPEGHRIFFNMGKSRYIHPWAGAKQPCNSGARAPRATLRPEPRRVEALLTACFMMQSLVRVLAVA